LNKNEDGSVVLNVEEKGTNSSIETDVNGKRTRSGVVDLIFAKTPTLEKRGYFEPHKDRILQEVSQRVIRGRNRC